MDKKLAIHEFDLLLNAYRDQKILPSVFEKIDIRHFQPENKICIELFRSLAVLWRDQKQINDITLEFKLSKFNPDNSDSNEAIISKLKTNKIVNNWQDDADYILYQWKKREINSFLEKQYNEMKKEYANLDSVGFYADKIIETIDSTIEEENSIDDILTSQPIIEFHNETMKRLFHGVLRKNINVIGGDTGHTKTTLTIFMVNEWLERGYKVLMFPIDGDYIETMQKLVALRTQVNSNLIVESNFTKDTPTGRMTQEEFNIVKKEITVIDKKFLKTKQLIIRDKETNISGIKLWIRKESPDIVIIDTIQAMSMPGGDDTQIQHGAPVIMKHLKQIAKQIDCAILLVAWMETQGKRPETWQIWFTKVIDKYAAKVWMLYYYYKPSKVAAFRNILEIIAGKERFGGSGIKFVSFKPEYGIYYELDEDINTLNNYATLTHLPKDIFKRYGK